MALHETSFFLTQRLVVSQGFGNQGQEEPLSLLAELEAKHRQDQVAVAAIRKELGMAR